MNILFVSHNMIGVDICRSLIKEGHAVKLFIEKENASNNFDLIVEKTKDWKKELSWVTKDGLIIFDDSGYGEIQDELRLSGYKVFGGSKKADELEFDRENTQKIFKNAGMQTAPLFDFENIMDAIEFAQKNPRPWVIKQNKHAMSIFNYVSIFDDGRDAIEVLKNYATNTLINKEKVSLHEKINGVEIGVARYFNGNDWVGPIEMSIEHKKFFPGDIGPTTSEMGTLAWYDDNEKNKLFCDTLKKMETYLKEINFRGDMSINCIVNESGSYPLEATPRFGTPIIHLQKEIHLSPWSEFLYAIACGKKYDLKYKKGYGIVVLLALPPFPYAENMHQNFNGMNIFLENLSEEELNHVHFEEISMQSDRKGHYYISDSQGYVLYVTGISKTVKETQVQVYDIVKKIVIPKVMYRNDIGTKFENESKKKLIDWGYL